MLARYTKLALGMGASFLLGTLLSLLLCFLIGSLTVKTLNLITGTSGSSQAGAARKVVHVTIDVSHRQEFFDQLRKFAAKNDFTILIDTRASGDPYFLIDMRRKDVEIVGINTSITVNEYTISFHDADPAQRVPDVMMDSLVNDLRGFVTQVPGTTFSVEK
jgi:hypothetical protein